MKIGITVCATKAYSYALSTQAGAVQNAVLEAARRFPLEKLSVSFILATNDKELANKLHSIYGGMFPKDGVVDFNFYALNQDIDDSAKSHKKLAQVNIGKLRTKAFNFAKSQNCDYVWSLDSDVIPKPNSLATSIDVLKFDNGYYEVASCPYPSQGGGSFLCGRGTFQESILRDYYDDEKDVNPKILKRVKRYEKEYHKAKTAIQKIQKQCPEGDKLVARMALLSKKIGYWKIFIRNRAMPKSMNVYVNNSKGWRRRGWFDNAYPAIGKGAIVPTDWTGFGCTLMNQRALNLIDFSGYEGRGTEDLFIGWQRWYLNGVKIAAIPHCPADHVIRVRKEKNKYSYIFTFHEPEGEYVGHLRQQHREFIEYV